MSSFEPRHPGSWGLPVRLGAGLLLSLAYALAGLASHGLGGDGYPMVWLPAAIALLAVVRLGPAWALTVPLGLLWMQWAGWGLGWAWLALAAPAHGIGAWLAGRLVHARPVEPGLGLDWVLRVVFSSALMPACLLVAMLAGGHQLVPESSTVVAMLKPALAELLGLAMLAPALLLALRPRQPGETVVPEADFAAEGERLAWGGCLVGSLLLVGWMASQPLAYPLAYTVLPLCILVWGAIRMTPLLLAAGTLFTMVVLLVMLRSGLPGLPVPVAAVDVVGMLAFLMVLPIVPVLLSFVMLQHRVSRVRIIERTSRDPLTGLLNRASLESAIAADIADAGQPPMAFAYLDLDKLALINDTSSHAAGDALIRGIAGVISDWRQPDDEVASVSGDEFVVLMRNASPLVAEDRVRALLANIQAHRTPWQERQLSTTASAGLVPFRPGSAPFGTLLSHADAACMTAKELGGNRVHVGSLGEGGGSARSAAMHAALRLTDAIEQGQVELHAQGIHAIGESASPGLRLEVLLRVRAAPGQALLPPGELIAAAERFGLGPRLDRHVLDQTLRLLETRPEALSIGSCSINLTGDSVANESFIAYALERIGRSSFPAHRLCFEITETSAVRNFSRARRFIGQLRALGCRFALDDFGTGFCSFGYLARLDVDYFKIDGSFVRDLDTSPLSQSVVRSIVQIAHVLGKQVIAEHTETDAHRQLLASMGVDFAQGYLFDRPAPLAGVIEDATAAVGDTRPTAG